MAQNFLSWARILVTPAHLAKILPLVYSEPSIPEAYVIGKQDNNAYHAYTTYSLTQAQI